MEFQNIYMTYNLRVFKFAKYILKNDEDARDVTQEVFIKLYKIFSLPNGKERIWNISSWLYTCARTTAYDYIKKFRKISFSELKDCEYIPHPSDMSTHIYLQEICNDLFIKNPVAYRRLIMYEAIGLSYSEIAKVEATSVNAVRISIYRSKKYISNRYYNDGYDFSFLIAIAIISFATILIELE